MMTVKESKKWLLLGAVVLLLPAFSFAQPVKERDTPRRQVPDGGSAAIYLLAVGATCLGTMAVRSRFDKSKI